MKKLIVDIARRLRKNHTPQENILWRNLRSRKLCGLKFLRQHPIIFGGTQRRPEFFVVDFYCASSNLIIELDGRIHDFRKDDDQNRDLILKELGLRVLRIRNEELADMTRVLAKIRAFALQS